MSLLRVKTALFVLLRIIARTTDRSLKSIEVSMDGWMGGWVNEWKYVLRAAYHSKK